MSHGTTDVARRRGVVVELDPVRVCALRIAARGYAFGAGVTSPAAVSGTRDAPRVHMAYLIAFLLGMVGLLITALTPDRTARIVAAVLAVVAMLLASIGYAGRF